MTSKELVQWGLKAGAVTPPAPPVPTRRLPSKEYLELIARRAPVLKVKWILSPR